MSLSKKISRVLILLSRLALIDCYDVANVAALADISGKKKFFCSCPDPDHHRAAFRRLSVINLTLETNKKNTIEQGHCRTANHLRYAACMRRELRDCFGTSALTSRAGQLSLLVDQAELHAALLAAQQSMMKNRKTFGFIACCVAK